MSDIFSNTQILNAIQAHYEFKTEGDFAEYLEIPQTTLSSWKRRNSFDIHKVYSKCTDINAEWLITGMGEMLVADIGVVGVSEPKNVYRLKTDRLIPEQSVPLYDLEATAGVVELFRNHTDTTQPIDYITIPNLPKCDGAIKVTGDSMYPLLKSGDIVMYKRVSNNLDNIYFGEMYLVSMDIDGDEYVSAKWVHKSELGDQHIKLVSENRHHQPKDVHLSKVKGIALIKASIRINSMV